MSLSTTERAKLIRQTLKAKLGLTARDVSVRSEYFSMGSSIDVKLQNTDKANALPVAVVEKIASEHESISRCEATGDILSGGNRYVSVNRSDEGCNAIGLQFLEAAELAIAEVSGTSILPVSPNCGLSLQHAGMWQMWGPDHAGMHVHTAKCAAAWAAECELKLAAGLDQRGEPAAKEPEPDPELLTLSESVFLAAQSPLTTEEATMIKMVPDEPAPPSCSVCGVDFQELSGGVQGCPVHGIREAEPFYDEKAPDALRVVAEPVPACELCPEPALEGMRFCEGCTTKAMDFYAKRAASRRAIEERVREVMGTDDEKGDA